MWSVSVLVDDDVIILDVELLDDAVAWVLELGRAGVDPLLPWISMRMDMTPNVCELSWYAILLLHDKTPTWLKRWTQIRHIVAALLCWSLCAVTHLGDSPSGTFLM